MTNQYKCQSYYDNDNVLQDCTCGKCGTDFREQVEDLLRKDYTTDVYGNLKDIIMVDGDLDSRVNFVDAIVKLHESETERVMPEPINPGLVFDEDFRRGFNRAVKIARERAAITPNKEIK